LVFDFDCTADQLSFGNWGQATNLDKSPLTNWRDGFLLLASWAAWNQELKI
jgi:hypothetical protein